MQHKNGRKLIVILYVDDGIAACTHSEDCQTFLENLTTEFKITAGPVTRFLGIEVKRQEDGSIFITHESYAKKVLQKFNMFESNPVGTPAACEQNPEDSVTKACISKNIPYCVAVGSLMYLATGTRPDIAHAVSIVSQKLDNATVCDWNKVKRINKYLVGTAKLGILYQQTGPKEIEHLVMQIMYRMLYHVAQRLELFVNLLVEQLLGLVKSRNVLRFQQQMPSLQLLMKQQRIWSG